VWMTVRLTMTMKALIPDDRYRINRMVAYKVME
jgi:hypothetical protein